MKSTLLVTTALSLFAIVVSAEKMIRIPISHRYARKLNKRDNNVALYNANGKEYLIQVGVGTPPQPFNLTLDTGSADFWVPSTACPATMCPHTRFNNQQSSTFQPLPQTLSIEYGIGNAKGNYGLDTLTIGSDALTNQTIGLISSSSNILSDTDADPSNGILGLGYPNLSLKSGSKPGHFVMGLYQSKIISDPIFSIFLNSQFSYGYSGEIVLGGIDTTKFAGHLQYAPVVTYEVSKYNVAPNVGSNSTKAGAHLYWAVPGQGITTSTGFKTTNNTVQSYILDTGSTLTYVPASTAKNLVMSLTANAKTTQFDAISRVYRVSCSLAEKNGTVQFLVSTSADTISTTPIVLSVPISELVIPLDDALTPVTSTACMFGIAPPPIGLETSTGDTWILGEVTLRSLYTVFDMGKNRVGFAPLSNGAVSISNSPSSASNTINDSKSDSSVNSSSANSDTSNISTTSNSYRLGPSMTIILSIIMTLLY